MLQQFNMLQLSASADPFAKPYSLLVHNWEAYLVLPYIEVMNDLDTSFLLSTEQCQNQRLTLHSKYMVRGQYFSLYKLTVFFFGYHSLIIVTIFCYHEGIASIYCLVLFPLVLATFQSILLHII